MSRRKKLLPHVEHSMGLVLENPFEFGKSGDLLDYQPKGVFIRTANGVPVPDLLPGWKPKLASIMSGLEQTQLSSIEALANRYVAERVARIEGGIESSAEIDQIDRIAELARRLNEELGRGWPILQRLLWSRLEQISALGGLSPLRQSPVQAVISTLHSATEAAGDQARADREVRGPLSYSEPWRSLVAGLASVCHSSGISVTAAKNLRGEYAKPSPFASLVWTLMTEAVPSALREHVVNEGAMQAAISKALSANGINKRKISSV